MATPFVAGGGDPTADLPEPDTFGRIQEEWNTFLGQPGGRAALLQAGLSLMQPPSFGDTTFGQIGRAIGSGGEAAGRQEAMDIRQSEAESKAAAREAAANLAGAKAAGVGAEAQYKQEKIAHEKTKLEQAKTIAQFQGKMKLLAMHGAYEKAARAANADIMNPKPGQPGHNPPPKSFEDWLNSDPQAQIVAQQAGLLGAAPSSPTSQQDQEALDWANAHPDDPRAAQIHQRLGR